MGLGHKHGWIPNYKYLKSVVFWVHKSGYAQATRMFLLGSSSFLGWDRLMEFLTGMLNHSMLNKLKVLLWLAIATSLIFFERLVLLRRFGYPEWVFIALFVGSIYPFLKRKGVGVVKSKEVTPLKNPTKVNKDSKFSIQLKTTKGKLPINAPQRGILILGAAGSGKTRYLLEPILYEFIKNGYCGIIYDYDFEGVPVDPQGSYCLSKFAYNCYQKFGDKKELNFKIINFSDPSRSVRINPIATEYIKNRGYLEAYANVFLKNLAPYKKDDFWQLSAKSLLKGIIVLLANKYPRHCTLPHVTMILAKPIKQVLELIKKDNEATDNARAVLDAATVSDQSSGQLIGISASLQTSLQQLMIPEIFWVLSKDELNLSINDAENPTILCIGNTPEIKSAISPVISLILTVSIKAMYGHGRTKSFVAIDELPTLYIPDFSELPATGRKYGISTVGCIQSVSQLEVTYGKQGACQIQENLSNQFLGNSGIYSSNYASSVLGKESCIVTSQSSSTGSQQDRTSETTGSNQSLQEKHVIKSEDFSKMEIGFFAGKLVESDQTLFKAQFVNTSAKDADFKNKNLKELPIIKEVSEQEIIENKNTIEKEVAALFVEEHSYE